MGSAISKSARSFPKRPVSRPPPVRADYEAANAIRHPVARASDFKDDEIMKDASDPHLLANLRQLGQVRVDRHVQSVQTAAAVKQAFASRTQADEDASRAQPPRNRLWAYTLFNVLEKRQYMHSKDGLGTLAAEHNMDKEVLNRLARFVNVPSVRDHAAVAGRAQDGVVTSVAEWREPASAEETDIPRLP